MSASPTICYSYDRFTGVYVGPTVMTQDPLVEGRFTMPACATMTAPPESSAGEIPVFKDEAWTLVSDHRGETWFNGIQPVLIDKPGDPTTFTPALTAVMTAQAVTQTLTTLAKSLRDKTEAAGITVQGVAVASDSESQNRVANAYAGMQVAGVDSVQFKATNGWVNLSLEQLKAIGTALFAHTQACFDAERTVDVGLAARPPTISTEDDVRAVFASVKSDY